MARTGSGHRSEPRSRLRMPQSATIRVSCCGHPRAIDLDGDAALQQIDRQNEESLFRSVLHQEAFDTFERPAGDPHALTFTEIRVRCHRKAGIDERLQSFDLAVRNRAESVPTLAEETNNAARFDDVEIRILVDALIEKNVAGEHRNADRMTHATATAPDADLGKEDIQTLRQQLVRDQLLRMTSGPDRVPLRQGSAPFVSPGSGHKRVDIHTHSDNRASVHRSHRMRTAYVRPSA